MNNVELKTLIKNQYQHIHLLELSKILPETVNQVFCGKTEDKNYIIKIYNTFSKKEIEPILSIQDQLSDYLFAPKPEKNQFGDYCTPYEDTFLTVQEMVVGKEMVCHTSDDVLYVAKQLAKIHEIMNTKLDYRLFNLKCKKEEKSNFEVMKSIEANQRQLSLYEDRSFFKALDELISLRMLSCVNYDVEYKPHELAIIHGDVRPSNILKSKDKFVFIDFDYLCIGDLCFEIGSAAMLFSNYDVSLAISFIETYLQVRQLSLTCYDVIKGTLNYYVQSSYPIKLIDDVLDHSIDEIAKSRINAILFCIEALNTTLEEKEC